MEYTSLEITLSSKFCLQKVWWCESLFQCTNAVTYAMQDLYNRSANPAHAQGVQEDFAEAIAACLLQLP